MFSGNYNSVWVRNWVNNNDIRISIHRNTIAFNPYQQWCTTRHILHLKEQLKHVQVPKNSGSHAVKVSIQGFYFLYSILYGSYTEKATWDIPGAVILRWWSNPLAEDGYLKSNYSQRLYTFSKDLAI